MNSGEAGSPVRRGPRRHAYQYVWPLVLTFAMPFKSTLTMASLKLRELSIQLGGGAGILLLVAGEHNDLPAPRSRSAPPTDRPPPWP